MKRRGVQSRVPILDPHVDVNDMLSVMDRMSPDDLQKIHNKATKLLGIPEEIWRQTFIEAALPKLYRGHRRYQSIAFQCLLSFGCVSAFWKKVADQIILEYLPPTFSNHTLHIHSLHSTIATLDLRYVRKKPLNVTHLTNLKSLILPTTWDATLYKDIVTCFPNLTSLTGGYSITPKFETLTNLVSMNVPYAIDFRAISILTNLTYLECAYNSEDKYLRHLTNLVNFVLLEVNSFFNESNLIPLTKLVGLVLGMGRGVSNSVLRKLPNLKHYGTDGEQAHRKLYNSTRFQSLCLFNDKSISSFAPLTNLTTLMLGHHNDKLSFVTLTNLTSLSLFPIEPEHFPYLTNLTFLGTNSGVDFKYFTNLVFLDLYPYVHTTGPNTHENLSSLTNLKALSLIRNKKFTTLDVQQLTSLTLLQLSSTSIEWENMSTLKNLYCFLHVDDNVPKLKQSTVFKKLPQLTYYWPDVTLTLWHLGCPHLYPMNPHIPTFAKFLPYYEKLKDLF